MKSVYAFAGITLFGLVFFTVGLVWILNNNSFVKKAIHVQGIIVDSFTSHSRKGGDTYGPIIDFVAKNGVTIRFEDSVTSNSRPKIGSFVMVYYNPDNPQDAKLDSFFNLYVFPGIFFIVGLIVILVGIIGGFFYIRSGI